MVYIPGPGIVCNGGKWTEIGSNSELIYSLESRAEPEMQARRICGIR